MKKSTLAFILLALACVMFAYGTVSGLRFASEPALMTSLIVGLVIACYYMYFDESRKDAKLIAITACLSALAAGGRVLFAALPNVQPATFIIAVTGYVFGPVPGFMAGSTVALVSNIFLGHGPWTPWQMLAWGLCGYLSGLLAGSTVLNKRYVLAGYLFVWGFLYGWMMNLYFVLGYVRPLNLKSFAVSYSSSVWFDIFHAAGNFLFALALGPAVIELLKSYRKRFFFEVESGRTLYHKGEDSVQTR